MRTRVIEYRRRAETEGEIGALVAACVTDVLADGLSLVYSFFEPERAPPQPRAFRDPRSYRFGSQRRPTLRLSRLLGAGQRQDGLQDPLSPSRGAHRPRLAPPRLGRRPGACARPRSAPSVPLDPLARAIGEADGRDAAEALDAELEAGRSRHAAPAARPLIANSTNSGIGAKNSAPKAQLV